MVRSSRNDTFVRDSDMTTMVATTFQRMLLVTGMLDKILDAIKYEAHHSAVPDRLVLHAFLRTIEMLLRNNGALEFFYEQRRYGSHPVVT